jgi:putative DNA primase/helicase
MNELIREFIDAMRSAGCGPHNEVDIQPTGEDEYYRLENDKKGKRGGYCFTIMPDGFAYGNFVSFKTGEKGSWHSGKNNKTLSPEERAAYKERLAEEKKRKQEAQDKRHEEKSAEAKAAWTEAKPAEAHAYLERKGISANGARLSGDNLIIQGVSKGKIWTYQTISPEGDKLFLSGARKQGCYFPITSAKEDKSIILICEGFATGCSIREATGLPVLCAFDAGNLKPVAEEMRQKYPNSKIVICCDNDQYGDKNTGLTYGQQAAVRVNGFTAFPEFEDREDEPTDFNDLHKLKGIEAVKDRILAVLTNPQTAGPESVGIAASSQGAASPPSHGLALIPEKAVTTQHISPEFDISKVRKMLQWKKEPNYDDPNSIISDGRIERGSLHNKLVFLRHLPKYRGLFRYDRFSSKIILFRQPPWHDKTEPFKVRCIRDADYTYIAAALERDGLDDNVTKTRDAVCVSAMENWINPPLEFFEGIKWDGTPRIKGGLQKYLGAKGDDVYLDTVWRVWLVSAIARIYKPGAKADAMIVLEGGQGVGKSTALKTLASFGHGPDGESYFCDNISFSDLSGYKRMDAVGMLQGKFIVEFPEMSKMNKTDVEDVKAWLGRTDDEGRRAYGRENGRYPRQFICAGTTNADRWLVDETGNRRFYPVAVGKIDLDALAQDTAQIWAEAVHLYKNGAKWWIGVDEDVYKIAEDVQKLRLQESVWDDAIERIVSAYNVISNEEIFIELGMTDVSRREDKHLKIIQRCMKKLGYKNEPIWSATLCRSIRKWRKVGSPDKNPVDAEYQEIEF